MPNTPFHRQGSGRLVTPKKLVEKENISIYIAKKREIFFVQLSLNIKRTEMARLEDKAAQVHFAALNFDMHLLLCLLWAGVQT